MCGDRSPAIIASVPPMLDRSSSVVRPVAASERRVDAGDRRRGCLGRSRRTVDRQVTRSARWHGFWSYLRDSVKERIALACSAKPSSQSQLDERTSQQRSTVFSPAQPERQSRRDGRRSEPALEKLAAGDLTAEIARISPETIRSCGTDFNTAVSALSTASSSRSRNRPRWFMAAHRRHFSEATNNLSTPHRTAGGRA